MRRLNRALLLVAAALVLVCGGGGVAACVAFGLGAQLLASRPAPAAGELTLTSRPPENGWPDRVTFRAHVSGPTPVTAVTLWYNFGGQTEFRRVDPQVFRPGTDLELRWIVETSGNAYLPPGTEFHYHYRVREADGQETDTPEQTFLYLDTRYTWNALRQGNVTVYYHGGAQGVAAQVLAGTLRTVAAMSALFGTGQVDPLRLMLYASRDEMDPAIPPDLRSSGTDFLTEGLTYQEQRVILVNPGVSDLLSNAAHEAAHLVSNQVAGSGFGDLPFWLSEGIAVYAQPDNGATYTPFVLRAIETRSLLHWRELNEVPGSPQQILTGYGQSALLVRFLLDRYGPQKLTQLVAAYRTSRDHDANLRAVYGKTFEELDEEWLAALDRGEIAGYPPRPR